MQTNGILLEGALLAIARCPFLLLPLKAASDLVNLRKIADVIETFGHSGFPTSIGHELFRFLEAYSIKEGVAWNEK